MDLTDEDMTYVRLLITDTDIEDEIFTDDEIAAVAGHESGLKRVAARLLLILAADHAMIAKKIRSQDLQTDGPSVAAELRLQADRLRNEAAQDDAAEIPALFVEPFWPHSYGWGPELTERGWH